MRPYGREELPGLVPSVQRGPTRSCTQCAVGGLPSLVPSVQREA